MKTEEIPAELRGLLERFGFERIPLDALRAQLARTTPAEAMHWITSPIAPPPEGCAPPPPPEGSEAYRALKAEGEAMIARGELAVVILAGGMATRFGSVVKGLATVFDDRPTRFLDIKLADCRRYGDAVEVALMTSFATHAAIEKTLANEPGLGRVLLAPQLISLRLTSDGGLFRDDKGQLSPHAPGHGDLPEALAASGCLARWRAKGVKTVLMSNVDNVGATIDPVLLAMHRRHEASVSVELVSKLAGDRGGLPVRVGERLVLAEAFRLPQGFPADAFPLFNTNTLWIDLGVFDAPTPWTWCVARKKVDGREAIQLERLVGELTWWHKSQYVHVSREGGASRFIPVKDLDDLHKHREAIEAVLAARIPL